MKGVAILTLLVLVMLDLLARFDAAPRDKPLLIDAAGDRGLMAKAVPAPPAKPAVPVDAVARKHFPKDDPALIDKLAYINAAVNASIAYEDDQQHYGQAERFVSFPADHKGDCEDYALTKIELLGNAGWPLGGTVRMDTVLVHLKDKVVGHAVAEVLLPSGDVMILDSNFDEPATRALLEPFGYQFMDWRA